MSDYIHICHDLKSEDKPVTPPLSPTLRLVPILFYLAVIGCVAYSAFYFMKYRDAEAARIAWEAKNVQEKSKMGAIQTDYSAVETDLEKAANMIDWVRGSRAIQPLAHTITDSIQSDSTIASLSLNRKTENPWQVELLLKLNGSDSQQLETTLNRLGGNYRTFGSERTQTPETLDYSTIVIWNDVKTTDSN